jgi:hypothetical protein
MVTPSNPQEINVQDFCDFLNLDWSFYPRLKGWFIEEAPFNDDCSFVVFNDFTPGYEPADGVSMAPASQLDGWLSNSVASDGKLSLVVEYRLWSATHQYEAIVTRVPKERVDEFHALVKEFLG